MKRRFPIALPSGHFMGLAPIDTWGRLLWQAKGRIGPRYWLRLGCAMGTSLLATAITLPERLVLGPWLAWRLRGLGRSAGAGTGAGRVRAVGPHCPIIIVTGYYRSGTTHLHNLLATHPDVVVPKWVQAMSPQGFWLSWAFLRWALVPFLPNTRPQDDVAFGPDWPAEDDFAHNNWALASSLPARLVLPGRCESQSRFHDLEGLTEREYARWMCVCSAFVWKVLAGHRSKTLVLKTPSHTARVRHLDRLFGERVRFVHIARKSSEVVHSNVAMHQRLEGQSLCPLPDADQTRERIIQEYIATEERFAADVKRLDLIESGRAVRLRYEALVADPIGQYEQVCKAMGLRWDGQVRAHIERYLTAVGEYTARTQSGHKEANAVEPRLARLDVLLGQIDTIPPENGQHAHPTNNCPTDDCPTDTQSACCAGGRDAHPDKFQMHAILSMWLAAGLGLGLWLGLGHLTQNRLDFFVWPLGGVVGAVGLRVAGRGTTRLGLWAALATLAMALGAVWPIPEVALGWTGPDRIVNIRTAWGGFNNNYVWLLFGLLSAWRYGSRAFARPPGI